MWNVLFSFTTEIPIPDEEANFIKWSCDIASIDFYKITSTKNRNRIHVVIPRA